jgi:hypothetical protein
MPFYTKLNFILGQSAVAEIQAKPLCGRILVNTGWINYKIQSVLATSAGKSQVDLSERYHTTSKPRSKNVFT